ncbi:hypothetical protein EF918_10960 [Streptomyces sp. WAC06614]|nr:hypothetical protein EF918_10960 [Streptomyces sp. WAC06614]
MLVQNMTPRPLTPWYMGTDMVRDAPRLIGPGGKGVVRGKADPLWPGSPADMAIDLRIGGHPNVLAITRGPEHGDFTAEVYGCGPWNFTFTEISARRPLILVVRLGSEPAETWAA